MSGFKDIIKREHIEAVEARQKVLENALYTRMFTIARALADLKKEIGDVREAQELFYDTFMERTWRGRFRSLVKWLGRKHGLRLKRSLKTSIAGAWFRATRQLGSFLNSKAGERRKSSTPSTSSSAPTDK
jgi:hypothetical protein